MKRVLPCLAVVILCASFLIVPASAASVNTSMNVTFRANGSNYEDTLSVPIINSDVYTNSISSKGWTFNVGSNYWMSIPEVNIDVEQYFTSPTGLYFSFFFREHATGDNTGDSMTGTHAYQDHAVYEGFYTDSVGFPLTVPVERSYFEPNYSGFDSVSKGYTFKIQYPASESEPITSLGFRRADNLGLLAFKPSVSLYAQQIMVIPSVQVITTQTSAELGALEDMADEIAAQSDILQAMYGDLISICNSIYQRCGDLLEAQNLANQYFASIIPILNAIQNNTGSTATNTANIYVLLQNQLALLKSTIELESGDIQDAIEQAVDDLISYLDTVFQSAVGQLPGQNQTTGGLITDYESAETQLFEGVLEGFSSTIPEQPEFSSELIAAFALINTIFNSIWDKIGDFKFVYIFSLTLAIILLAIGRISKFAGAGSSKGGPAQKPGKGGSDGA